MAVARVPIPHLPAISAVRPGLRARRFSIGFLVGVLLVLAGLVAFRQAFTGRILPGVAVGGVELGSLSPDAARAALVERFGPHEDGQVVVHSSRGSARISYAQIGRAFDFDAMVAAAMAVGRDGSPFAETVSGLRQLSRPVSISAVVGFEPARLEAELAAFAARVRVEPLDAAVTSGRAGFSLWQAVNGARLDLTPLAPAIAAGILDPMTQGDIAVEAAVVGVAPEIRDAEARRALDLASRIASDVVLTQRRKSWTITAAEVRTWITFARTDEGYLPTIKPAVVPGALRKVAKDVARKPREATFLKDRSGHVLGVSSSGAGSALDLDATTRAVVGLLEARAHGASPGAKVKVVVTAVAPELSTDEAVKKAPLMVRIGTWTTRYTVSPHNGNGANITVPTRKLDGVVVRPGETFDFWKALGEVSFRTGYRLGGAIVGGHTVEGRALAGGICAASTTLFNAAARGGLDIVTRSPHWYYIKRYPVGLDATVSDSQTMRFRNDTPHPILIRGIASPGLVRFEIWSVPNGRTVTWTKPSITNVVEGYDTVRKTTTLPPGRKQRIEWPVDGMDVSVTRTVRDASGHVVHRDTFVSHYHRMVGVTLIGS